MLDSIQSIQVPDYGGVSHKTMRSLVDQEKTKTLQNDQNSGTDDERSNKVIFNETSDWSSSPSAGYGMHQTLVGTSQQDQPHQIVHGNWMQNLDMIPSLSKKFAIESPRVSSELDGQQGFACLRCPHYIREVQTNDGRIDNHSPTNSRIDTGYWRAQNMSAGLLGGDIYSCDIAYHQGFDPGRVVPSWECLFDEVNLCQSHTPGDDPQYYPPV